MKFKYLIFIINLIFVPATLFAAPLDNLLKLDASRSIWNTEFSFSVDRVNETLDVLNIRGQDKNFAGTTVGDYQGYSGKLDVMLWQGINLNAATWQRQIDLGSVTTNISTWKLGGQWDFFSQKGRLPSVAIGYNYWFNKAGDMTSASSRTLLNITVDQMNITDVADAQHQIDLIASWSLKSRALFSVFFGMGRSEVSYDQFIVNYNGCQYSFASPAKDTVVLSLAQEVTADCQVTRVKRQDPTSPFTGPGLGMSYTSQYYQLGSTLYWQVGKWALNAGVRTIRLKQEVDDIINELGKQTTAVNYIGLLALSRGITKNSAVFVRGQYYYRSWLGEIPLTYNVFTSNRFDRSYGLLSLGVNIHFG